MNWRKTLLGAILPFLLLSASCGETKDVPPKETKQEELVGVPARVTTAYAQDGCDVLLEISEEGESVLLMPINLEDQFKIDGKKVQIVFHSSRIAQSTCQKGRPVVIETIKFVD